jgi:hypothetical protein
MYKFIITTPSIGGSPSSPDNSPPADRPPTSEQPLPPFAVAENANCGPNSSTTPRCFSETDLYNRYVENTSRTLSLCQSDYRALRIGMPTLAQRSPTVFHSLLAVSAASIAWDIMSSETPAETNTVKQVLLTGYEHYNLASETMREAISMPNVLDPEALIASALMLVPFATATQQINNWMSAKSGAKESHKPLSSTPRDVIIIMRGIRTMLQCLGDSGSRTRFDLASKPAYQLNVPLTLSASTPAIKPQSSSRTHAMSAIVSATSQNAFHKLRQRLDSALSHPSTCPDDSLSACRAALDVLERIRSSTFSAIDPSPSPCPLIPATDSLNSDSTCPPIASWLRSFSDQFFPARYETPRPDEPLTRFFLSFLIQAPQEYLDLVLPLLDQRLESPINDPLDCMPADLTKQQALGLDIYAHWSVLMFLVEEESWWIGTLPEVTLTGMVNRYGDEFVANIWPEVEHEKKKWWPGSMLSILREFKRYK